MISWKELLLLRQQWKQNHKKVVWTNGCFDLVHVGHVRTLQAAKKLGEILVVGLNTDASVKQLKGPSRPILPEDERAELLMALSCVDYVILFDEPTPEVSLTRLQPDIHCKGSEYAPPHGKAIPEAELVRSFGGTIEFLPMIPNHSTSLLIEKIWTLDRM